MAGSGERTVVRRIRRRVAIGMAELAAQVAAQAAQTVEGRALGTFAGRKDQGDFAKSIGNPRLAVWRRRLIFRHGHLGIPT